MIKKLYLEVEYLEFKQCLSKQNDSQHKNIWQKI